MATFLGRKASSEPLRFGPYVADARSARLLKILRRTSGTLQDDRSPLGDVYFEPKLLRPTVETVNAKAFGFEHAAPVIWTEHLQRSKAQALEHFGAFDGRPT